MIYETPNLTALSCFPLRLLLSAQKSFCVQRLQEHRGDVSSREMGNPWGSPAAGYRGGHELWRVPGGWKQPILPQPCTSTGLWGSRALALISLFARPLQGLMRPVRHSPAPLRAPASSGGGFLLPEG